MGRWVCPRSVTTSPTTDNFPDRKDPARRATHGQLRLASLPWFNPSALSRNANLG